MPVVLDVSKEQQVPKRVLEDGVPLDLGDITREVVMTKYVSNDPLHADWQPLDIWDEEVTADIAAPGARPRIQFVDDTGATRRVSDDDGLIIKIRGTLARIVGMVPGLPPMSEQDIDRYKEANPRVSIPLYQQWDFRVREVLKTNGPEGRRNLLKGEDQRRLSAQTDLFQKQEEVFSRILAMFQAGMEAMQKQGTVAPNAQAVVDAGAKVLGVRKA